MDGQRFDALTRSLAERPGPRRGLLRGLLAGALAGVLGWTGGGDVAADVGDSGASCFKLGKRCRHDSQCCTRRCRFGECARRRNGGGGGGGDQDRCRRKDQRCKRHRDCCGKLRCDAGTKRCARPCREITQTCDVERPCCADLFCHEESCVDCLPLDAECEESGDCCSGVCGQFGTTTPGESQLCVPPIS